MFYYERLKRRWLFKSFAPWRWVFIQCTLFFTAWSLYSVCVPVYFTLMDRLILCVYGIVYALWKTSAHLFLINYSTSETNATKGSKVDRVVCYVFCFCCIFLHFFIAYVYGMLLVASVDVKQWYGRAWSIYVFELNRLLWLYAFLTFVVADLLYTYSSIQWRSYRSLLPLLSKQPNQTVTMDSIPYLDNVD